MLRKVKKILKDYSEYRKDYESAFSLFDKNLDVDLIVTVYDKSGEILKTTSKNIDFKFHIDNGNVIKVDGLLKELNYYDYLVNFLHKIASAKFNKKVSKYLADNGFENIHKVNPTIQELTEYILTVRKGVSYFQGSLMSSIVYHLFKKKDFFYNEMEPNIRYHLPITYMTRENKKYAEKRLSTGQATVHGPHIDSWFWHPYNTINVWAAIGKITKHNGLWVMPNTIGIAPKYNEKKTY